MISYIVFILFKLIYLALIIVILLSWIPLFDTRKEPLASLVKFYNVIMRPIDAIIPPIGMISISPIIAFILLQLIEHALLRILYSLGL
jgi:YggT family protein